MLLNSSEASAHIPFTCKVLSFRFYAVAGAQKSDPFTEETAAQQQDTGFPVPKKSACSSSGRLNCFLHGKSSDLWIILGRAFPGSLPVTLMRLCPQIQQRDCSGFTPDSLLGQPLQSAPQRIFNYAVIITCPCRAGKKKNAGTTNVIPAF